MSPHSNSAQKNTPSRPEGTLPLPLLVCAACGPMGKAMARAAKVCCDGVEGIVYDEGSYRVKEPINLPTLLAYVKENPPLQAAIQAICIRRYRSFREKNVYLRKGERAQLDLARCTRAALLLGDEALFNEMFALRVTKTEGFMFGSGISHADFWNIVLGFGMAGSELVPEGEARTEIVNLEARWYALCASPAGRASAKGLLRNHYLQVAAALRAADKAELQSLSARGNDIAAAGCAMLEGRWAEAAQLFEQELGWTIHDLQEVRYGQGAPLLVYALLCVVLGKGKQRTLDAWLRTLTESEINEQPSFLQSMAAELLSFCYHLKAVDGLLNRKSTILASVRACSAFGALPLVLAYAVLPDYARTKLPVEQMGKAVDMLAEEGHVLLAAYGAAALPRELLSAARQARMEEVMAAAEGVSLPGNQTSSATEAFLSALEAIAERERGRNFLGFRRNTRVLPILSAEHARNYISLRLSPRLRSVWLHSNLSKSDAPFLHAIKPFASAGRIMLNTSAALRLSFLSVDMLSDVELQGSLRPPGQQVLKARPVIVMALDMLSPTSALASLRVELLPGAAPLFVAGRGLELPLLSLGDKMLAVQRDLKTEAELCHATLTALKISKEDRAALRACGGGIVLDLAKLMSLLQACRRAQLPVMWRGERRIQVFQPTSALKLHLGQGAQGWLELGAELEVDEGKVLELSTLLAAFSRRKEHYVQIGEDEFVFLDAYLERQLTLLELVWQKKGSSHVVHRSALPLLEALARDEACSGIGQKTTVKGRKSAPGSASPAIPKGMKAELRPYQKSGFEWLVTRSEMGLGVILADDMGLGKTVQLLALLLHEVSRPGAGPSLVIAPVSLLGNWAAEASRFAPSLKVVQYNPKNSNSLSGLNSSHLVLVSYGQLASHAGELCHQSWNIVALDEAQAIKTPDSQRARAVCSLNARMRCCLTGTPIENSLLDLWSEMRFLNPGLFGSRESFSRTFARCGEQQHELLRQVLAPLVLRRSKGEVLKQLPSLTETLEWVDFSTKERALYESIRRKALRKLREAKSGGSISMLAELTRLRRSCCHGQLALENFAAPSSKLERMLELVTELKEEGRRVLIFSQFTDVLDLAEPLLEQAGVSWLRLDGSTPAVRRTALVRRFQKNEGDVFLISLKAGGVGLNLTAADYVLLLDPWWNPAVEDQAASRAHRMGQQNPVTVCRLVVRGTVEERILQLQQSKKDLAESILAASARGVSLELMHSLLTEGGASNRKKL